MLADVICDWKMTSFIALDLVTSFLRLKDVTNTGPDSLVNKASALGAGGRRFDSQCRRHWGLF